MSLLQKASIITTPTAYAEDFLYSIKPAIVFGDELVTNGDFESATGWSPYSGATISGGVAYLPNGGSYIAQNIGTVTGKTYKFTVKAKGTAGTGDLRIDSNGVKYTINNLPSTYETYTGSFIADGVTLILSEGGPGEIYIEDISVVEMTDADFAFDRNSTATRVNEEGLIEEVPYNIAKYSQDFSNGVWTKDNSSIVADSIIAPDGTLTGTKVIEDTALGRHGVYQNISSYSIVNTFSAYVKDNDRRYVSIVLSDTTTWNNMVVFDLTTGTITKEFTKAGYTSVNSISAAGNDGWYRIVSSISDDYFAGNAVYSRIYLQDSPTPANPPSNTYTGDGTSSIYVWGAQLTQTSLAKDYYKTIDKLDIPRIDFTGGTGSILLEPSRTNLITYSTDFSQWTADSTPAAILTSNATISPDGTQNADKLIPNSSNARQAIKLAVSPSGDISMYVFAKKGEYTVIQLTEAVIGSAYANFDLDNGVLGSYSHYTPTITDMGNGWYKCSVSFPSGSSINAFRVSPAESSTSGRLVNFTGNSSDGLYIYGAQVENNSYPTSYIPTNGSTQTRSAEACNNAGNSDLLNPTEGVLYAEISTADLTGERYISIGDGSGVSYTNRVLIGYNASGVSASVRSGGSNQAVLSYAVADKTIFNKIAIKWKLDDFALWVNGVEEDTDTSGSVPTVLHSIAFDDSNGLEPYYGNTKCIAVFKEALTDTELTKLTS